MWSPAAAAAAVAIGAIAFSQLGSPQAVLDPAGTQTETVRTPEATTTEPNTTAPTDLPPGTVVEPCGAVVGEVALEGVSEEAGAKALTIMDAALSCSGDALIHVASTDQTMLSLGGTQPQEAFAIPNTVEQINRYELLTTLFTLTPEVDQSGAVYQWPAAPQTDADWQRLIDAGLITAQDRDSMIDYGGYIGYRIVIDASGTWTAFLAGD